MRVLVLGFLAALACGCDVYHYQAGRFHDGRGRLPQALAHYEAFIARNPDDPRCAQLHVRSAQVYAELSRCLEARRHYETAARRFPKTTWAELAKTGIMACPDFFPISGNRSWVYGDSASAGRAMRLEWKVEVSSAAQSSIRSDLFAGPRRLRSEQTRYSVSDWTIWRTDSEGHGPLLRYPFRPGNTWTAKRGKRELVYRVEDDQAEVKVVAGNFSGCLKIRETTKGFDSWKYDYYCPFVGRALTTVAGPGYENRNTELLAYSSK